MVSKKNNNEHIEPEETKEETAEPTETVTESSQNKSVAIKPATDFQHIPPLADYFKNETGINFDKQATILKSKLTSFCKTRDINSFADCLKKIKSDNNLKQQLFNYLTTNETYFYREFDQIKQLVNLVSSVDGRVDILCMPCSTGEEPYSITIALLEASILSSKFRLVGVDINTTALERAREGIYRERNISKMPNNLVKKYFKFQDEKYSLNTQVKALVNFKVMNLFDKEINRLGKFDYILSRNMLIYFDKETKTKASKILDSLLKDKTRSVFYGHADLF